MSPEMTTSQPHLDIGEKEMTKTKTVSADTKADEPTTIESGVVTPLSVDPEDDLAGASGFNVDEFIVDKGDEGEAIANEASITVGKPHKQTFFRTHPKFSMQAHILTLEEGLDKTEFLLTRRIAETLAPGEYRTRQLRLLVTNFGELLIYPVGLPGDGVGGGNSWVNSAREAVALAEGNWLRMATDRNKGRYIPRPAEDQALMGDPRWPEDISAASIIARAFCGEAMITDGDHPALLKLRGRKL